MSDTPETDRHVDHMCINEHCPDGIPMVHADFARKLERERDGWMKMSQRKLDPEWLDRVPPDVVAAAALVSGWFARETWGEWEMGGLASRQRVFRLEEELATMERERDEARRSAESYRARWPHYEWFPWEEGGS